MSYVYGLAFSLTKPTRIICRENGSSVYRNKLYPALSFSSWEHDERAVSDTYAVIANPRPTEELLTPHQATDYVGNALDGEYASAHP